MRAAILTREFPPDVYGGAGVHVDFLVRELRRLIDVDVHCMGEPRDGATAHTEKEDRLLGANSALQVLSTDIAMTAARRCGRLGRRRALPHVVRQHGRALGEAAVRRTPRRDRAQPRAAAAVEGRAAGRRLPDLLVGRADRLRVGRRGGRGQQRHEGRHPQQLPGPRRVPAARRLQRHRHRLLPPRPGDHGARADRGGPDPAVRRVRRPDHPAEGRAAPAAGRARLRPGPADRAARRRRRHSGAQGRDGRR